MTGENDAERQRLAEWKAHLLSLTDDANTLIAALQHQSPEVWQSYRNTVEQQGIIEAETFNAIHQMTYSLFPTRQTREVTDLLQRMLDIVKQNIVEEKGQLR